MRRSSFSETPLLRVSRPVSACSRCRAAKVKCDGKLPACTACEKAGREADCSGNDQFARGKERSYVAALELRVEKLERRLAYARSRSASLALPESDPIMSAASNNDRKDSLAVIRAAITRKAVRNRENSDVNSLVSDFGYLSVNANTRDFEPSIGNMTFARLVLAATANDPLQEPALLTPKLPSRQTAYATVQYYLSNVHAVYPFFAETTILSHLEELYQVQPPQFGPNLRDADYWMIYMVLAIASSSQSRNRHDSAYANGVHYVSQAMRYADGALAPGHMSQIQSLLLLTIYSMFDPSHFDSWHLIGITCRAIVDLGFHQDPPQTQNIDAAALDARRCTFYCAYALDRAISMVHARAFSFTDDGINVAYPTMGARSYLRPSPQPNQPNMPPSSLPPAPSPALLLFQLRRAQSHWYQTLYQGDPSEPLADPIDFVWKMCSDMREWAQALPRTLPPAFLDKFDTELQYSYVYCIAPSAGSPMTTPYGRMLIFEHVIAYMDRIGRTPTITSPDIGWHTYHDALRVFFMGSQFIAVLRDASTADAILAGGGSVPLPLALPGQTTPPPMPVPLESNGMPPGPSSKIQRAISCIESVGWILNSFGNRWEDAERLATGFKTISRAVLDDLWARRASADKQAAAGHLQQQQQHHHHHVQQHHSTIPQEMGMSYPPHMQFQAQPRPPPMHYSTPPLPPSAR